jgi:predicted amidohydrolase
MKIAVIQLCSVLDYQKNLDKIQTFITQAKENCSRLGEKLDAVFLPEVFYSMSDGTKPTPHLVEEGNEHYQNIAKLASDNGVYLIGGTAATNLDGKVMNRTYNFDPSGKALLNYDKIHLFTLDLSKHKKKTVVDETVVYSAGNTPSLLELGEWKIGLGICFDLRFPELYRHYFSQGANIMTVASAFTVPTGKAHWKTLIRARAIENQSYVIAADQWGVHNDKLSTYGHSLVVDPWGEIIAEAGDGEGYVLADLDQDRLEQIRARLNVKPKLDL